MCQFAAAYFADITTAAGVSTKEGCLTVLPREGAGGRRWEPTLMGCYVAHCETDCPLASFQSSLIESAVSVTSILCAIVQYTWMNEAGNKKWLPMANLLALYQRA